MQHLQEVFDLVYVNTSHGLHSKLKTEELSSNKLSLGLPQRGLLDIASTSPSAKAALKFLHFPGWLALLGLMVLLVPASVQEALKEQKKVSLSFHIDSSSPLPQSLLTSANETPFPPLLGGNFTF